MGLWCSRHRGRVKPSIDINHARLRLERGKHVDAQDSRGHAMLHYAAISGDIALATFLIEHQASVLRITLALHSN